MIQPKTVHQWSLDDPLHNWQIDIQDGHHHMILFLT